MRISSRTPEGERHTCDVCGKSVVVEPCYPVNDAVCPACGSHLWLEREGQEESAAETASEAQRTYFVRSLTAPAADEVLPLFDRIAPASGLPRSDSAEITWRDRLQFEFGWRCPGLVRAWGSRRRRRARSRLVDLMCAVSKCETRKGLEAVLGRPGFAVGHHEIDEYYRHRFGLIVLRYRDQHVTALFAQVGFTPAEVAAGLAPESMWLMMEPQNISRVSSGKVRALIRSVQH